MVCSLNKEKGALTEANNMQCVYIMRVPQHHSRMCTTQASTEGAHARTHADPSIFIHSFPFDIMIHARTRACSHTHTHAHTHTHKYKAG